MRGIVVLLAIISLYSCSTTKSLSDGEYLYTGSSIKIKKVNYGDNWKIEESAKKYSSVYYELWDTPNGAMFGLPRFQGIPTRLWIYNAFYTEKDKNFPRWMRNNFGEKPITLEDISPGLKVQNAVGVFENFGHFGTIGDYSVKYNKKNNKAYIRYSFLVPKSYSYRNILYETDSTQYTLGQSLLSYKPKSILTPGEEFNLDNVKLEKSNIWNHLQNDGYYFLKADDVEVEADTTVGYKQLDVKLKVANNLHAPVYQRQHINRFDIAIDDQVQDKSNKYYRWDSGKIRKDMLDDIIKTSSGDNYSLKNSVESVRNLHELGVFANPRIAYSIEPGDSLKLNASLAMNSIDATSIGLNFKGNYKNTGYIGPSIGFGIGQLNVFGGAENLSIDADAYYDIPIGAFKERISNSSGFSLRSTLSAPLLKTPFKFINSNHSLPKEYLSLNLEYNDRKDFFKLVGLNATYGFTWKSKPNITHKLDLVSATFSNILNSTPRFDSLVAENPLLKTSLVDQFILGSSYTFRYDNSSTENKRIGTFFEGNVDLSGNLLNLAQSTFSNTEKGERKFLGIKYAQYTKLSYDFRAYWRLGEYNQLVFRNVAGIGLSYGNSNQMPYIKQFIIGGSNSLRPINARSVGPGRYIELDRGEVNQTGDLKLEWNLEYRFRLFWKLNGAIWSDAGNIWLLTEDPNRPYSGVRWGKIFEDSYLTSGVGLRFDLNVMILRFDYGTVLYAPIFIDGYKWSWQNGLTNWFPVIGFGYPF